MLFVYEKQCTATHTIHFACLWIAWYQADVTEVPEHGMARDALFPDSATFCPTLARINAGVILPLEGSKIECVSFEVRHSPQSSVQTRRSLLFNEHLRHDFLHLPALLLLIFPRFLAELRPLRLHFCPISLTL